MGIKWYVPNTQILQHIRPNKHRTGDGASNGELVDTYAEALEIAKAYTELRIVEAENWLDRLGRL